MKKFLTVLLALSVVFTYSFSAVGSAFAATPVEPNEPTYTHNQAMVQAVKEVKSELNQLVAGAKKELAEEYTVTVNGKTITVSKAAYAATLDQLEADFNTVIDKAAEKTKPTSTDVDELKTAIKGQTVSDVIIYDKTPITVGYTQTLGQFAAKALADWVTDKDNNIADNFEKYYAVRTFANALPEVKADMIAKIAKVDMNQYTDDIASEKDPFHNTWKKLAQNEAARLNDVVNKAAIDVEGSMEKAQKAVSDIAGIENYYIVPSKTTASGYVVAYKFENTPENTLPAGVTEIKTAKDLGKEDAENAATKAELKAVVAQRAAEAIRANINANNYAELKEHIDSYVEVYNVLIDAEVITTVAGIGTNVTDSGYTAQTKAYKNAERVAAALKLVVEKDGTLKYDAAVIDKNLKAMQLKMYQGKALNLTEAELKVALSLGAEIKSDNLAWEKEVAIAAINAEKEALLDAKEFYAPELEKINAAYQAVIDKVNAVETSAQLETITGANPKDTTYVDKTKFADKDAVKATLKGHLNFAKFTFAAKEQIEALNGVKNSWDADYRNPVVNEDDAAAYLAENDARTNADIAKFFDKAADFAKTVLTNGEIEAADTAAKTLIDALPAYITLADKDAVKAAYDAAIKAGIEAKDFPAKLKNAIADIQNYEKEAIDDMIKALPAKLTAADKAKVDAIYEAIEAFNDEEMFTNDYPTTKVDAAFETVRAAALADVQNAIAALSANPTKAQVEAARAAVEEFVKTYTDAKEPYQAIAMIVNLDKLTYAEAQVKANIIASVEGLKLSVSTKLYTKSNKIRVNWTVKDGDASYIDGYQVYKSTKAQKNYKFMGKTKKSYMDNKKNLKKGTRYFYKVRAYVEIDGQKYYSDWSNKGNRIYK